MDWKKNLIQIQVNTKLQHIYVCTFREHNNNSREHDNNSREHHNNSRGHDNHHVYCNTI